MECFLNQLTLVAIHIHLEQLCIQSDQKITHRNREMQILFSRNG